MTVTDGAVGPTLGTHELRGHEGGWVVEPRVEDLRVSTHGRDRPSQGDGSRYHALQVTAKACLSPPGSGILSKDVLHEMAAGRPAAPENPLSVPSQRGLPPEGIDPPVARPDLCRVSPASRPAERRRGGCSLYDEHGGEWRYHPGDRYHNPHWDYNPHDAPNSPWRNVPIGGVPVLKGG